MFEKYCRVHGKYKTEIHKQSKELGTTVIFILTYRVPFMFSISGGTFKTKTNCRKGNFRKKRRQKSKQQEYSLKNIVKVLTMQSNEICVSFREFYA